jgi:S-adenosylmethionine:diacylglycerol 3-amino-3-carboxypropyl transferase
VSGNNNNSDVQADEVERAEKRMYLDKKVTPVLSKMLIHIVNEKPTNLVQFMIEYLKGE